jgi:hypothetical protein
MISSNIAPDRLALTFESKSGCPLVSIHNLVKLIEEFEFINILILVGAGTVLCFFGQ